MFLVSSTINERHKMTFFFILGWCWEQRRWRIGANVFYGQSWWLCMGTRRFRHSDHANVKSNGKCGSTAACKGKNPRYTAHRNHWRASQWKIAMFSMLGKFWKNGNRSKATMHSKWHNIRAKQPNNYHINQTIIYHRLNRLNLFWIAAYIPWKLHCSMAWAARYMPSLPKDCWQRCARWTTKSNVWYIKYFE